MRREGARALWWIGLAFVGLGVVNRYVPGSAAGYLEDIVSAIAVAVLWLTRKERMPVHRWLLWAAIAAPILPVIGNSFGWIFTEVGRQPWLVFGLMTTHTGVSPGVSMGEVITSMAVFTLLYGALAIVEIKLFLTYVRRGAEPYEPEAPSDRDEDAPLAFAY